MATLTTTTRGQITFRKELFRHLGVKPGERVDVDQMPDGSVRVRAVQKTGRLSDVFNLLPKPKHSATLEEIEQAIQDGWAGRA